MDARFVVPMIRPAEGLVCRLLRALSPGDDLYNKRDNKSAMLRQRSSRQDRVWQAMDACDRTGFVFFSRRISTAAAQAMADRKKKLTTPGWFLYFIDQSFPDGC